MSNPVIRIKRTIEELHEAIKDLEESYPFESAHISKEDEIKSKLIAHRITLSAQLLETCVKEDFIG